MQADTEGCSGSRGVAGSNACAARPVLRPANGWVAAKAVNNGLGAGEGPPQLLEQVNPLLSFPGSLGSDKRHKNNDKTML